MAQRGITGGIDLSVGAVMALAGALVPPVFNAARAQGYPVLGLVYKPGVNGDFLGFN